MVDLANLKKQVAVTAGHSTQHGFERTAEIKMIKEIKQELNANNDNGSKPEQQDLQDSET